MGCWRFGGSDKRRDVGILGAWTRTQLGVVEGFHS